jgi:hypothetical protein
MGRLIWIPCLHLAMRMSEAFVPLELRGRVMAFCKNYTTQSGIVDTFLRAFQT